MCSRSVCVFVDVFIHVYVLQVGANSYFVNHLFIINNNVICICVAGEQGRTQFVFWLQQTFPRRGILYQPDQLPW